MIVIRIGILADLVFEPFYIGIVGAENEAVGIADEYFQSAIPPHDSTTAWTPDGYQDSTPSVIDFDSEKNERLNYSCPVDLLVLPGVASKFGGLSEAAGCAAFLADVVCVAAASSASYVCSFSAGFS